MAEPDPNNPGYDTDGDPLVKGVITAVGTAVGSYLSGNTARADRLQEAMHNAVVQAHKEGITESEEIINRKLSARDKVLEDIDREEAERLEAARIEAEKGTQPDVVTATGNA